MWLVGFVLRFFKLFLLVLRSVSGFSSSNFVFSSAGGFSSLSEVFASELELDEVVESELDSNESELMTFLVVDEAGDDLDDENENGEMDADVAIEEDEDSTKTPLSTNIPNIKKKN